MCVCTQVHHKQYVISIAHFNIKGSGKFSIVLHEYAKLAFGTMGETAIFLPYFDDNVAGMQVYAILNTGLA